MILSLVLTAGIFTGSVYAGDSGILQIASAEEPEAGDSADDSSAADTAESGAETADVTADTGAESGTSAGDTGNDISTEGSDSGNSVSTGVSGSDSGNFVSTGVSGGNSGNSGGTADSSGSQESTVSDTSGSSVGSAADTGAGDSGISGIEEEDITSADADTDSKAEAAISTVSMTGGVLLASKAGGTDYKWSVSSYYVNESDLYDVEKNGAFTLKYQMEFTVADETLGKGSVEIRVPASLFTLRDGSAVMPYDIGVPYGEPGGDYTENTNTPFNYYYETDQTTGVEYIVFWNYREIEGGTNTSLQVMYKVDDIVQVEDGTTWEITPEATVTKNDGLVEVTEGPVEADTLTGLVDTTATLSKVTKKAYSETGKAYTPGLYTESQVQSYIGALPDAYSGDNFDNYVYVLWLVEAYGDASQVWDLTVAESTYRADDSSITGSVVGYAWNLKNAASIAGWNKSDASITDTTATNVDISFYVVTAYPKSSISDGDVLQNDITLTLTPEDGDAATEITASAQCTWEDYNWVYGGDGAGVLKTGKSTYSAWLEIWRRNADVQEDTGELTFTVHSTATGYDVTHYTSGSEAGTYKDGTYFQAVTADDAIYAWAETADSMGDAVLLDEDDYYFSSVTVQVSDHGYDVWEDATATAEAADGVDQKVYIYAMYANPGADDVADAEGWYLAAAVDWNDDGSIQSYTFDSEQLEKEPYRVKAVHNSADYSTECYLKVGVTLRADSPTLQGFADTYGDDLEDVVIRNYAGALATRAYLDPTDGNYYFEDADISVTDELDALTNVLYGNQRMTRARTDSTLTALQKTASATKTSSSQNDSANSRVLVDYYLTAYEGYYVTGSDAYNTLKEQGG